MAQVENEEQCRRSPLFLSRSRPCSKRIRSGKVQLPDFQRGWVWDDDRIKDLLISISRGFPVGAVMTVDAGGDISFRSRLIEGVDGNGIQQTEQYLLDGQQRLTSLHQAMLYSGPVETRD